MSDEGLEVSHCGSMGYLGFSRQLEELASNQEEVQGLCPSNHTVNNEHFASQPGIEVPPQKDPPQCSRQNEHDIMQGLLGNDTNASRNHIEKNGVSNKMSALARRKSTSVLLNSPSRQPITAG